MEKSCNIPWAHPYPPGSCPYYGRRMCCYEPQNMVPCSRRHAFLQAFYSSSLQFCISFGLWWAKGRPLSPQKHFSWRLKEVTKSVRSKQMIAVPTRCSWFLDLRHPWLSTLRVAMSKQNQGCMFKLDIFEIYYFRFSTKPSNLNSMWLSFWIGLFKWILAMSRWIILFLLLCLKVCPAAGSMFLTSWHSTPFELADTVAASILRSFLVWRLFDEWKSSYQTIKEGRVHTIRGRWRGYICIWHPCLDIWIHTLFDNTDACSPSWTMQSLFLSRCKCNPKAMNSNFLHERQCSRDHFGHSSLWLERKHDLPISYSVVLPILPIPPVLKNSLLGICMNPKTAGIFHFFHFQILKIRDIMQSKGIFALKSHPFLPLHFDCWKIWNLGW